MPKHCKPVTQEHRLKDIEHRLCQLEGDARHITEAHFVFLNKITVLEALMFESSPDQGLRYMRKLLYHWTDPAFWRGTASFSVGQWKRYLQQCNEPPAGRRCSSNIVTEVSLPDVVDEDFDV